MQEIWITLTLPALQHQRLAKAFDLQLSRSFQPCLRPLLVPDPCVPHLFRVLPLSLVLLCRRAKIPPVIFIPSPVQ